MHTYIDLFAGCGGLSLGLYNSKWKGVFAIEKSPDAFLSLQHNLINKKSHFDWPKWLPQTNHDINEIISNYKEELVKLKGKITMVAGGPPCQGFSMAGMRKANDKRNELVDSYIEFVSLVKPRIVFFENVKGFTMDFKKDNPKGKVYSDYVKEKLEELGYNVKSQIMSFNEYGIPQRRKRFILVGSLNTSVELFFQSINDNKESFLLTSSTIEEAISDLLRKNGTAISPDSKNFKAGLYGKIESKYQEYIRGTEFCDRTIPDSHRFVNHRADTIKIFKELMEKAPKNKSISGDKRKKYGIKKRSIFCLGGDFSAPTLTTNPDDYIHYCEPRILTVREYARIQSFPDWYEFKGKYTTGGLKRKKEAPRYTQIGNAIPPLFAEQAGLALKELIK